MEWTEISVEVNIKDLDKTTSIAHMVSSHGIYIEDYSCARKEIEEIANIDLIDDKILSMNPDLAIVHIYIAPEENPNEYILFMEERFKAENIKYNLKSLSCSDEDWINNWKKHFKSFAVGNKLMICPSWEETDSKGRTIIKIDPGMAFGTGTHETTQLCLKMVEKYLKKGNRILDIGCGSGILSIACLLLGAKEAIGVDIDPLAVNSSLSNAKLNNIHRGFTVTHGSLTENVSGSFDLIVSNIVADAIIKLSDDIEKFMNSDCLCIFSGIIDIRADEVKTILSKKFIIIEEQCKNGWYSFAVKRF